VVSAKPKKHCSQISTVNFRSAPRLGWRAERGHGSGRLQVVGQEVDSHKYLVRCEQRTVRRPLHSQRVALRGLHRSQSGSALPGSHVLHLRPKTF
jgi:hypothetical protein